VPYVKSGARTAGFIAGLGVALGCVHAVYTRTTSLLG